MIIDPNNLLEELNDYSIPIFTEFITKIQTELFFDIRINCVYDSLADSVALNKQDPRNPLYNFHEFGIAIDMNIIQDWQLPTERVYLKHDSIEDWESTGVPKLAESLGIRWGGLFKGYEDCVHFDLANKLGDNVYIVLNKLVILAKNTLGQDLACKPLNKLDLTKL